MGATQSTELTPQPSRRRYIARGNTGDTTAREPVSFHPSPNGKIITSGSDSIGPGLPVTRAQTFDTSSSGASSQYSEPQSTPGGVPVARAFTTDCAIGHAPLYNGPRLREVDPNQLLGSQHGRRDSGSSDTSYRSARSDVSADTLHSRFGFKVSEPQSTTYSAGSYPATFPGSRSQPGPNWLGDISKTSNIAGANLITDSSKVTPKGPEKPTTSRVKTTKSATLPAYTSVPFKQSSSQDTMDKGPSTGSRHGIRQSLAALFGSKKSSQDSSVQLVPKAHSMADIVICSPKQARPFSGRFKKGNFVDSDDDDFKKGPLNSASSNVPQMTAFPKYERKEGRSFDVVPKTSSAIATSRNNGIPSYTSSAQARTEVTSKPVSMTRTGTGTCSSSSLAPAGGSTFLAPRFDSKSSSLTKEERIAQYKDRKKKKVPTATLR